MTTIAIVRIMDVYIKIFEHVTLHRTFQSPVCFMDLNRHGQSLATSGMYARTTWPLNSDLFNNTDDILKP